MHLDNVEGKNKDNIISKDLEAASLILQVIVIYVTLDMTIKKNTLNQNNII